MVTGGGVRGTTGGRRLVVIIVRKRVVEMVGDSSGNRILIEEADVMGTGVRELVVMGTGGDGPQLLMVTES